MDLLNEELLILKIMEALEIENFDFLKELHVSNPEIFKKIKKDFIILNIQQAVKRGKIKVLECYLAMFPFDEWMNENYIFYPNNPNYRLYVHLLKIASSSNQLRVVVWLFQNFTIYEDFISKNNNFLYGSRNSIILHNLYIYNFEIVRYLLNHKNFPKQDLEQLTRRLYDKNQIKKLMELSKPIGIYTKPTKM